MKQNYNNFWNGVRITRSRERERNHFFISMIDITGKNYQELRVQKRERKQPSTIPDLPYLHWERTGHAPAGPYSVCISYYCSLLISCEIDKNISYMKFKQVLFSCEFHDKYNFLYFTIFVDKCQSYIVFCCISTDYCELAMKSSIAVIGHPGDTGL